MAFPTSVNNQITDSVAPPPNISIVGEAPVVALGNLYQAVANSLANAAQNAVLSQQQSYITAQAATTMAVATIYAVDTATAAAAAGHAQEQRPLAQEAAAATDVLAATPQTLSAALAVNPGMKTIEEAIAFLDKQNFDNAEAWSKAAREIMGTMSHTLCELQGVVRETGMTAIKQAAIAMALAHLIQTPDKVEQYHKIIELIKALPDN